MDLPPGYAIDAIRADEVSTLIGWAAAEGWNPGLADADIAWSVDPEAFIALRREGELVGGGTIMSSGGAFGFMGLFIVRADLRGEGLGAALWHHRRDRLIARLRPGASIGMDGVFAMVPFYARGGFTLAYRDLRLEGNAAGEADRGLVELDTIDFATIDTYDRRHVPAPRSAFLSRWLAQPGAHGVAAIDGSSLTGYALLRPCRTGWKFGPVFADDAATAERLVSTLMARVDGEFVQLDVPEPNTAGLALAARHGLAESFGCARMYFGPDPGLPIERIYGVTSFEFG